MEFIATDPRGIKIFCDEDQWNKHISAGHHIMSDNQNAVKYTITNPCAIYESNDFPTRDVYFSLAPSTTYKKQLYTKVIVEMNMANRSGEIVTTFPCPHINGNIKEGGLKYVKSKL